MSLIGLFKRFRKNEIWSYSFTEHLHFKRHEREGGKSVTVWIKAWKSVLSRFYWSFPEYEVLWKSESWTKIQLRPLVMSRTNFTQNYKWLQTNNRIFSQFYKHLGNFMTFFSQSKIWEKSEDENNYKASK